jgi:hypothetical protein
MIGMPNHQEPWRWKSEDGSTSDERGLLYEPGNWGDVLKGVWAVIAARWVIRARSLQILRYSDPFAGSPAYPLVEAARRRLKSVPIAWFQDLQAPFVARNTLASTASLIREAVLQKAGGSEPRCTGVQRQIYDADPCRRERWNDMADTAVLAAASAEEALERMTSADGRADFLLVDPYDLFDRSSEILPNALRRTGESVALLYLYNRSPRGGGHLRTYRALRQGLELAAKPAASLILGRIPADASLPRAYHEVILAGPKDIVGSALPELNDATCALSQSITAAGAFELLK